MTVHASGEFWNRKIGENDPLTMDFSQQKPAKSLAWFCRDHLKPGDRVLDLGCGGGRNSHFLAEKGYEVYGMDIAENAVKFCRARFERCGLKGRFRQGDFRELPYPDRSFSGIICVAALDHVSLTAAEDAIKQMRRVLKPGGAVLITFDPPDRDQEIKGEAEVQEDGSLYFISGLQKGMLFRRYTDQQISDLIGGENIESFKQEADGGRTIICR